jgi:hypothetical protein
MIEQAAGAGVLQQIGARVGMSPDQVQSAITSLAPVLTGKLEQHSATGALDGTPAVADAPAPGSDAAQDHGNVVLGSILGSDSASHEVASGAAADTGIDIDKIKAVLPQLASIAAVAYAAHNASAAGGGGLGGLIKGVEGGFGLS